MLIKIEIKGLIDAARIIAGAINGLANRLALKPTLEKTSEIPEQNRKKVREPVMSARIILQRKLQELQEGTRKKFAGIFGQISEGNLLHLMETVKVSRKQPSVQFLI